MRTRTLRSSSSRNSPVLVAMRGLVVLVLGSVAPSMGSAQQSTGGAATLIFDRVTVVDVERGKLLPDRRVVIIGNRIKAVGGTGAVAIPKGAQVVDARGKYLIPGLWDVHIHGGFAPDLIYRLLLANGVTGIRDAGSPLSLDTLSQLRREILAGTRVGPPRQFLSGQSITNYSPDCVRFPSENQTCVGDTADARHYVDSLKAAGADMIKPRDVTPPMYFVIAAEARRVGIPFGGHTWDDIDLAASDSGALVIDHARPHYDTMTTGLRGRCWAGRPTASVERCQPVVEQFRRNHTWVVPTMTVERSFTQTEKTQLIFQRSLVVANQFWSSGGTLPLSNWLRDSTPPEHIPASAAGSKLDSLGVLRIMQRTGFPLVAGTDAADSYMADYPPGFLLHTELAIYVAEGLTPLSALQSATLNPAKMWHLTDSLGTVAPGKLADLVLLDADPLVDITNTTTIRAVVANGRYFDRAALDQLLANVQAKRP